MKGFRGNAARLGRNTSHVIFDVIKHNTKTGITNCTQNVYLHDFARAFETMDHDILISKLEIYGMGHVPLNFFRNYITGRTKSTTVNGNRSENNDGTYGTAQST